MDGAIDLATKFSGFQEQWNIGAFLLFAFAAAVTPGPSNMLVMNAGARLGLIGGLRCLAGVVAGMGALMGLAALGLSEVLRIWPAALLALKLVGSTFLLWLAWQVAHAPAHLAAAPRDVTGFWKAFAFQWVNPKSWVVAASVAATFAGADPSAWRAALIGLGFASAATVACGVWLAFGAMLQRWLGDPARARVFHRTMGISLAGSILLLWT